MSKENRTTRRNIVIVGGGHAGADLARQLSGSLNPYKYRLILINERPFAVHLPAAARMTVSAQDKLEDLALIPYDKLFINGNGEVIVGKASAIEERAPGKGGWVVLENEERVEYALLVLACGFLWSGPLDFPFGPEDMQHHIAYWRKMYEQAQHIVLIGGGAVGIETAGEIRDVYPNKKITIVQADDMLLNATYPERYRRDIERRSRARGIEMVFSELTDYIPEYGTVGITTRSGMSFPTADLIVPTFGPRPNTSWIASLGPEVLDERGLVRVEPTFEVVGHPGVFTIGDITNCNEQKQAQKCPKHVEIAAPNILSFLEGRRMTRTYKGTTEIILIPLGRNRGCAYLDYLWGIIMGDWFVRLFKSKDLFVNQTRQERGL